MGEGESHEEDIAITAGNRENIEIGQLSVIDEDGDTFARSGVLVK